MKDRLHHPWGPLRDAMPVIRLKRGCSLVNKRTMNADMPYLGLENIEPWTGRLVSGESDQPRDSVASLFEAGDVLFGKLRPYLAKVVLARSAGRCTSELLVLRSSAWDPRFLQYALLAAPLIRAVDASTFGTKMPRADWQFIGQVCVPVPERASQLAVTDFLDAKTGAIDDLIAKKRQLTELLKEKRRALITQCLSRGLDRCAPLKETGIPSMPKIPRHWHLHQLRRVVSGFVDYRGRTPEKTDDGIPLITAGAVREGIIDHARCPEWVSPETHRTLIERGAPEVGDLLFTSEAPLGEVGLVKDANIACAQRIILFKVDRRRMEPEFLRLHFLADSGKDEILSRASGSTADGIRADRLKMSVVPTPPLDEQRAIISHVAAESAWVPRFQAILDEHIAKLLEYREVLITAAVTGKMDIAVASEAVA